jgi:putative acetyltransferase
MRLYERSGFRRIPASMGATGHGGCNTFYLLDL